MNNTRTQGGGFPSRMMRSNLRPVVLFAALSTGLWSFLWALSSFRLATDSEVGEIPGLKNAALSNGILYIIAAVIQLFDLSAAWSRQARLVRIYAYASVLTALCVLAGSLIRIVIHFTQKKALLSVCTNENAGDTIFYSWGIWGPVSSTTLDQGDVADWCNQAWSRTSWSNILAFIIELCVAFFFLLVIFGYYKQLLDPSSAAYAFRSQNQYPLGAYPSYVGFAPPQGPPPGTYERESDPPFAPPYDNAKLPAYDGSGKSYGDTKDGQDDDPFGDHRNGVGRSHSGI